MFGTVETFIFTFSITPISHCKRGTFSMRLTHQTQSLIKSHRELFTQEQETALFEEWQRTNDPKLFRRIILNYTPIVRKIANELSGYKIDPEELISEGMTGLVDSARRFDLKLGFRFSTYARSWIQGVMYGYIVKNYFMLNVCTNQAKKKLFFSLRRLIAMSQKGSDAHELADEKIEELAVEHGLSFTDIHSMYNLFRNPYESLSDPIGQEEDRITKGDLLVSPTNIEAAVIESNQDEYRRKVVALAIQELTDREREIFVAREMEESDTLETLGVRFSISKERVRQIQNTAREKVAVAIKKIMEQDETNVHDLLG